MRLLGKYVRLARYLFDSSYKPPDRAKISVKTDRMELISGYPYVWCWDSLVPSVGSSTPRRKHCVIKF